jgi:hypothetical protein
LIDAATDNRITQITGLTLSTNSGMLALARKLGFEASYQPGDATVRHLSRRLAHSA